MPGCGGGASPPAGVRGVGVRRKHYPHHAPPPAPLPSTSGHTCTRCSGAEPSSKAGWGRKWCRKEAYEVTPAQEPAALGPDPVFKAL